MKKNNLFKFYNFLAKKITPHLPFTYYWYLLKIVGKQGKSILDLGCGWGDPMEVLQKQKRRHAVGVDIFQKYLSVCRKKAVFDKLILSDVRKFQTKEKFDIVICSHVIEHLKKSDGLNLIKKMEKMSKQNIVITSPIGDLLQEEYDGNKFQKHISSWQPYEFQKLGYKVVGIAPRYIFGKTDTVRRYGIFAFFLFLLSLFSQRFYQDKPEKCVYMIAYKRI